MTLRKLNHYLFVLGLLLWTGKLQAQKPPVGLDALNKWSGVTDAAISSDGNYVLYYISQAPAGHRTLVIKSVRDSVERHFEDGTEAAFSGDSRRAVFRSTTGNVTVMDLNTMRVSGLPGRSSFEMAGAKKKQYLVCSSSFGNDSVIIYDLATLNRLNGFAGVQQYSVSPDNNQLFLQMKGEPGNDSAILSVYDLSRQQLMAIFRGDEIRSIVFDRQGKSLCFIGLKRRSGMEKYTPWHYNIGDDSAVEIYGQQLRDVDFQTANLVCFTRNGQGILYNFPEPVSTATGPSYNVSLDIWGYKGTVFHSSLWPKPVDWTDHPILTGYLDIDSKTHLDITAADESVSKMNEEFNPDYVLVIKGFDGPREWVWNPDARCHVYLHSLRTGKRIEINPWSGYKCLNSVTFSPNGKYVVYFDVDTRNYFSYSIDSGVCRNMTAGIPDKWTPTFDDSLSYANPIGVKFIDKGNALLAEAQEDVYLISLSGKYRPVNLTNGYGKRNNIVFSLPDKESMEFTGSDKKAIILCAFDRGNKRDGFFKVSLVGGSNPVLLSLSDFFWNGSPEKMRFYANPWIKAAGADVYLQKGMNFNSCPNYYLTRDFVHFVPISNVHPERKYNWLTAELINWVTFDGSPSQAILYKPENFDPNKKYPIIFHYYERLSEGLHGFMYPEFAAGPLDIPYFVSNGYLVCTPDIHYSIGHPGASVVNTVASCAKFLCQYPWVDAARMGIQGHSRGGYETNFLLTHSDLFAAAISACGMSDYIGLYNRIGNSGTSGETAMEVGYQRIGATLWDSTNLYLENSPIFRVDKVKTPVLLVADIADTDIPFAQGMEMFTALRRLGKKCWLLQYDNIGHTIAGDASVDYTIRMKQFFDYYLKGALPPKWMTEGVPAAMKGIDSGLEPDLSGKTP